MSRQKRNSTALEQAERRLESLRSIARDLDLGRGLSVHNFAAILDDLATKLAAYNTALSNIDKMADDIRMAEKAARAMSEQMLMGVGSHYGRTSQEYEMAGGSRRKGHPRARVTANVPAPVVVPTTEPSQNGASATPVSV
ncbi:hypothetical protein XM38_021630 [Halomicronema hongdechloris C2206]|uniref:Uncharacterized protein n=1 Tax=Halomicronema hongdechloris C2206 TaxID=1641165 RepID=A0A1Z3HLM8_9CYAN|nr:hypothetical protein [Halomicronema hongdechloris]ASC71211.1 hypothetical protein XM38_021630 [Halomicronema hongdechloris C2206]